MPNKLTSTCSIFEYFFSVFGRLQHCKESPARKELRWQLLHCDCVVLVFIGNSIVSNQLLIVRFTTVDTMGKLNFGYTTSTSKSMFQQLDHGGGVLSMKNETEW